MLQQARHDLRHAAPPCSSSSPSTHSIHQAAAAWARFEHGGSTCITPHKAQGVISAGRLATSVSTAGPSRFKQEFLRHSIIHHYSSLHSPDPAFCTEDDNHRRRHSFHSYDLTERSSLRTYSWRFSRSGAGSAPNSPCFNMGDDADQKEVDDGEGRNTSCKDEATSLLDKFEVEAVRRQLRDHFGGRGLSVACTPSSACGTKLCQEHCEAQNARHHDHPQAHLKHHGRNYLKSSDASTKPSADNEHNHTINDVVHRLLHLRIKMTSRRSTFASGPVLCSSIATANSIVDPHHHRPASPVKEFRAVTPGRQTKKWQQDVMLHDRSPNRLYHADAIYSKAFHESLVSRTRPHSSTMLGHNMHGDNGSRDVDDTLLRKKQQDSQYIHIHHFHHHYHHQLKHIDYKPQDALLLQDHQVTDKDGKQYVQHRSLKLHTLRNEKRMIPHGGHH